VLPSCLRLACALLVLTVCATACPAREREGEPYQPSRPLAVPKAALWVGGPDGGVWVLLEKNAEDPPGRYRGAIFHEGGLVWYEGALVVDPPDRPDVDLTTRTLFGGWDGDELHLNDGRTLRATGPILLSRPASVPREAFLLSAGEGDVFVLVEKRREDPPTVYRAKIFHAEIGRQLYDGQVAVEPLDRPQVDLADPKLFVEWDGEKLVLADGRVLRATELARWRELRRHERRYR